MRVKDFRVYDKYEITKTFENGEDIALALVEIYDPKCNNRNREPKHTPVTISKIGHCELKGKSDKLLFIAD